MEHASLTNNQDDLQSNTISEDFQPFSLPKITSTAVEFDDNLPESNSAPEDRDKSKAELSQPKKKYAKITNQRRLELIDSVENKGQNIKQAAQQLKMNYSSAKSIFQVFKKEGRSIKKAYKQRYAKQNNNDANLEIPNPPCDNKELTKLLLPSESQASFEIKQKQENLENLEQQTTPIGLKDKLLGSYVGNSNQSQSLSDTYSQANSLTPMQNVSGLNKSPLMSDINQTQFQQVFLVPTNFGSNQTPQMRQNNGMNMQQGTQTRYEMRSDNFNTINFVPQQQTYMVYQGNMQPVMIMNPQPQPMFQQQNNFQGGMAYNQMSQSQSQINEQNQKMMNFNELTKIEIGNQNSNTYMVNNQNSNEGNRGVQMNMYPVNQMQYYMPTSTPTTTYFVGGNGNNNNNNNIQGKVYQQVQPMQPMMYVQSQQPNYHIQTFTASSDVYMPQQGGFFVFGDVQNQSQMQGNQANMQDNMMKAKNENL